MILETQKLMKSFGGLTAVYDVNLQIQEGELVSIIGPNGAGKTTLFNLLTGHLPPDSGRVIFQGQRYNPASSPCHFTDGDRQVFPAAQYISQVDRPLKMSRWRFFQPSKESNLFSRASKYGSRRDGGDPGKRGSSG